MMDKITISEEYYEAHIPKCCRLKTVKAHMSHLLLCWGILHEMEAGIDTRERECGKECDEHINHDPKLLEDILGKGKEMMK